MSIETWGDMNKSQIDATLIETRIAEMISEHNDDPTAHMADDQSIGLHRINDILDHPAKSVVPDKTSDEFVIYENMFNALTTYSESGNVDQSGGGGIVLNTSSANSTFSEVQIPWPFFNNDLSLGHDVVCDFISQIIHTGATYDGRYMFGGDDDAFGFEWNTNGIRGFFYIRGVQNYTSYSSFASGGVFAFRIFIDTTNNTVNFYMNGVLIGSISFTGNFGGLETTVYVATDCGSASATQLSFGMLHLSFKMF